MQHFIADDGECLHVQVSGEGPPVILLHGWTSSHRDWNPFVDVLSADHHVLRWDARGHATHALQAATAPTVQRMARDLANLLDHWHLERAVLVGHSMGALTLWQYLQDFGSDRVAGVVIVDQSPRLVTDATWRNGIYGDFDTARNAAFIAELEADFGEAVLRLTAFGRNGEVRRRYTDQPESFDNARRWLGRLHHAALIACWRTLTAADYRAVLPAIDVPALLVYGAESNFYSRETAEWVAGAIPDARLTVYPGADHSPHLHDRARFGADLDDFLARVFPR
ncbi:MAG TPA: alpha/beta hydrolase [Zoogloea sp.]|uniref:alpha/beta fold hydrolase n=1 Tax=Zoogloea sp. TaxID=49181 RepID=UPI002BCB2B1B|nr:alpha/beta hydrolase [Zoogloea sp.]HMV16927.1 alpha/beta hydrolase [Rhodocyclaceae bacterium]HMV62831.1 alpha/beta hydrolase [Rhodocyclaceae bacterium]HMW51569.1 alpha/beta hydrolase [Rhodocyclaceae bacterium]HNB65987.1 alpha/beta hydrolase [Rhodocyclaceae bacterium]HNE16021.1 alpha/beta hydrolase [Rhodocyclaceae bacterium]